MGRNGICHRSRLPPFVEGLVFSFGEVAGHRTHVQNFYHLGDFFVVSDTLRRFLENHSGCTFESKIIKTKHPSQERTERFWAMKVTTRHDCILPDFSFAKRWSDKVEKPFSHSAQEVRLTDDIAPYFANKGNDIYYAYPDDGVRSVSMNFSSIPQGVRLFEPLYWPQFLVIDSQFAYELEAECRGGSDGYYFWTLGFDDISNEHFKTMTALR
jgi:hypothetical protein